MKRILCFICLVTINFSAALALGADKVVVIPLGSGSGDAAYGSSTSAPDNSVFVNDSGNVGIDTTSPSSKLDVRGSSDFDRNGIISANVYSGNPNPSQAIAFRAQLDGNPLDIGGYYEAFVALNVNNGGGSANYIAFKVEAQYTTAMQIQSGTIDYITGMDLTFNNDSDDVLTLTSNGDIGIGTTSPGSKLAVVGLPSGTNDSLVDGTLAGALCITDTGNLYIDTDGTCAN